MIVFIGAVVVITGLLILVSPRARDDEQALMVQRRWRRLNELDKARTEYVDAKGIEPTPAELWLMTPPEEA
jgi:hypothetical protein